MLPAPQADSEWPEGSPEAVQRAGEEARPAGLDAAVIEPAVRKALGHARAVVEEWRVQELGGSLNGRSSIHRVSGTALVDGQRRPWSLIWKVAREEPSTADPSHSDYWKRECLLYGSGWLETLPAGLVAPACFGLKQVDGSEAWLWLEDVDGARASGWSIERFGLAATHLGRFNGAFLLDRPPPSAPWLSRRLLRAWVESQAKYLPLLRERREHPLVRLAYPADVAEGVLRLWGLRQRLFHALEGLPQTFCHLDVNSHNLFSRTGAKGEEETVAIDWEFAGTAPVGQETAALVSGTLANPELDTAQAEEFDAVAFGGYLEGLREAGWSGDPRQVRFAHAAACALRHTLGDLAFIKTALLDESRQPQVERIRGRPMAEVARRRAEEERFRLRLADEALTLLEKLG